MRPPSNEAHLGIPAAHRKGKPTAMTLNDELYFEITLTGPKSEIKKFAGFLKSGGLDEFFDIESDYISYDDNYATAGDTEETSMTVSNDDYGIEIDDFDTDDFLDVFCRASKALHASGTLYDLNDEEYNFKSEAGCGYYINADKISIFNEDEDKPQEDDSDEENED